MQTGMIVAGIFIVVLILVKRGYAILETLSDFVECLNKRKPIRRKRVPTVMKRLRKLRVVKALTDEQVPQVKKHIREMSALINRHMETIHQHREAAVALAHSLGLTAGRMQYEMKYAKQMNMINAAVAQLITEADRISAFDEEYKQQVHDWILAMRKSLEDSDPIKFDQMTRADSPFSQRPLIHMPLPVL